MRVGDIVRLKVDSVENNSVLFRYLIDVFMCTSRFDMLHAKFIYLGDDQYKRVNTNVEAFLAHKDVVPYNDNLNRKIYNSISNMRDML